MVCLRSNGSSENIQLNGKNPQQMQSAINVYITYSCNVIEIMSEIGIGPSLTTEPSHTTGLTDP